MDKELKYTLITGASRGIGNELARECASRGMNLILVAKNEEGLKSALQQMSKEFTVDVKSFVVDLRDLDGPQRVWDWCSENGYRVNILINNAGVAGTVEFTSTSPAYSDDRIMVNVRSLVLMTRLFLPELITHPRAHILNIGSISAYFPIPYKSVYAASKAFVLSFSLALNEELKDSNIKVTLVNPNGVPTNTDTYERMDLHPQLLRSLFIIDAAEIARISIDKMLKGRLIVIPGLMNRILIFITGLIPPQIKARGSARIFKKEV